MNCRLEFVLKDLIMGQLVLGKHTGFTTITESPRKFGINFTGINRAARFDYSRELYFDPRETVGLGTIAGVGIGSTLILPILEQVSQISIFQRKHCIFQIID